MWITRNTATLLALAVMAISFGAIAASNATSATRNPETTAISKASQEPPIGIQDNEITKNFLIGYPMAIQPDTANKVSVNDYPWLGKIVKNGEAMVSYQELVEFVDKYNKNPDFAVILEDGKARYYNINWYRNEMIPNTAYVKAYWIILPENATVQKKNISEAPELRQAVDDHGRWIPLEDSNRANAVAQFLQHTNTRYVEAQNEGGSNMLFQIRHIDADQKEVTG